MKEEKKYVLKNGISKSRLDMENVREKTKSVIDKTKDSAKKLVDKIKEIDSQDVIQNLPNNVKRTDSTKRIKEQENLESSNSESTRKIKDYSEINSVDLKTKKNNNVELKSDEESLFKKKKDAIIKQDNENRIKNENRANILYGDKNEKKEYLVDPKEKEILDRHEKFEQGKIPQKKLPPHKLENLVAVNYIHNPAIKKMASAIVGIEAAENLHMSKKEHYLDTDYAKQHLIFNNYKEVNSDLQPYWKEKITKQIGADKLESTKGIYIDAESTSSKKIGQALFDNKKFADILYKNIDKLKNGIPFDSSINFTDENLHNAIGNADLLNVKKNKRGDIELIVADTYDFNENETSDLVRIGREKQEKGDIIPYFLMYHVIIPKNSKFSTEKK